MIFSFFKRPRHRKYTYLPRYYDPAASELEERLGAYKNESDDPAEVAKNRIRHGFRSKYGVSKEVNKRYILRSNLIIIITIVLLLLITYIFLIRFLPLIEQALQ